MRMRWWISLLAGSLLLAAGGAAYALGANTPSSEPDDPSPVTEEKKDSGVVAGTVTDAEGEPVEGALVAPEPLDNDGQPIPEIGVLTSEDGSYEWKLPPGSYEITIHLEGDELGGDTVTVEPNRTANGDITVDR